MPRLVRWIVTAIVLGLLLWQIASSHPFIPPFMSGLLLLFVGLLTGMRLAADSASPYIQDMHRLNKTLADQNRELDEANYRLLKQREEQTGTKA